MLILLDIDGVMVPANSWKRPEFLRDGFPVFSQKATNALRRIVAETDADILLTSTHKANYSIAQWKEMFELRGIKVNNIDCLPENLSNANRKDEILNWYNSNSTKDNFVIIDDDKSLNGLPGFLKEKLVQTSPMIGLTDELADEALRICKRFVTVS